MLIPRFFSAVILSLALAFAGISTSAGGLASGGLTSLTLCTETGPEVITLNSRGEPVEAEHFCLDCCLTAALTLEQPDNRATAFRLAGMAVIWGSNSQLYSAPIHKPHTRGPPRII